MRRDRPYRLVSVSAPMNTLEIYEAGTKLSEICERITQTDEPVIVTRRGVPLVQIRPVGREEGVGSTVWELRDRFIKENGDLEVDLELPPRTVDRRENPF